VTTGKERPAAPGASRRRAEPVDGLFLLNKPAGLTSNQALQKVKRLLAAKKAGHTGSLDPAATGMLPLCFGEATKVCAYLLDADKSYRVTARLGEATDTGDAEGTVIEEAEVPPLSPADWERLFERFTGEIEQVPPMYSALRKDGKRLYELARKGQVVEREPRKVRIHELSLLEAQGRRLVFRVRCSKGTYVRTLVEDLAKAAGTVAHTAALHRETVADFDPADMLEMRYAEELAADGPGPLRRRLLPADAALKRLPARRIAAEAAGRFVGGQAVAVAPDTDAPGREVRVYEDGERFLGIGETAGGGIVAPRRIFRPGGK
jgi:tRNA pseudouridine55 synthase